MIKETCSTRHSLLIYNLAKKKNTERFIFKFFTCPMTILPHSHSGFDKLLSHSNPSLLSDIAITNFLASHTREIRFHDVIDRAVRFFTSLRHPTQKFQNMAK